MQLDQIQLSPGASGIDHELISHQRNVVLQALSQGKRPQFKILDTCRFDNGGLLTIDDLQSNLLPSPGRGVVAFVPAAGAASRYAAPLAPLVRALEQKDLEGVRRCLDELAAQGATAWPLPASSKMLLADRASLTKLNDSVCASVINELSLPKALMPCVEEGVSFLQLKDIEHQHLRGLEAQVFVAPAGMSETFASAYRWPHAESCDQTPLPTGFVEQGPRLSTIRMRRDGSPLLEPDGSVSIVPAGHGALAGLFHEVRATAPAATTLFIRNIDNVIGTLPKAQGVVEAFLSAHRHVLTVFNSIRIGLAHGALDQAAEAAASLLLPQRTRSFTQSRHLEILRFLEHIPSPELRSLWDVLLTVVHAPIPHSSDMDTLRQLYDRPVNLLGQVPNTGNDVGGTPCFVETKQGCIKLCLEVPHASEIDKREFLANPSRATHFNPVFVAAEIPADSAYYAHSNREFWLLSEKTYRGEPVVYYETVLYELLGNSSLANVIFVEVSRDVFNPHKVLADAANRSIEDWTQAVIDDDDYLTP